MKLQYLSNLHTYGIEEYAKVFFIAIFNKVVFITILIFNTFIKKGIDRPQSSFFARKCNIQNIFNIESHSKTGVTLQPNNKFVYFF